MPRSGLRNLCCEAIGQASAFYMVPNTPSEITEEDLKAIKDTAKLLHTTLLKMMKVIQEDEHAQAGD